MAKSCFFMAFGFFYSCAYLAFSGFFLLCLSVCLSVCLFVCLSLSVCLSALCRWVVFLVFRCFLSIGRMF